MFLGVVVWVKGQGDHFLPLQRKNGFGENTGSGKPRFKTGSKLVYFYIQYILYILTGLCSRGWAGN